MTNYTIIELDEAVFDGVFLVNSKKAFIPIEKIEGTGQALIRNKLFNIMFVGGELKTFILTNTKEEIQNKLQELKQTIKN